MERKKRSKGSVWEFCYANKIFGTFGVEMRAPGHKLIKFCTLTHAAKLVVRVPHMTSLKCDLSRNRAPLSYLSDLKQFPLPIG